MRRAAAVLVALLLLAFVGRAAWVRQRAMSGNMLGWDYLPWERSYPRAMLQGAPPLTRACGAYALELNQAKWPIEAEDAAALEVALGDPQPLVRAAALDVLLHAWRWDVKAARPALLAALLDDAPIVEADLEALAQATSLDANVAWAAERWRKVHGQAPLTRAALATAWILDFLRPQLVLSDEVFRDEARRRAIAALDPGPFTFTPGDFERDRTAAATRVGEWARQAAPGKALRDCVAEPAWVASARAAAAPTAPGR